MSGQQSVTQKCACFREATRVLVCVFVCLDCVQMFLEFICVT